MWSTKKGSLHQEKTKVERGFQSIILHFASRTWGTRLWDNKTTNQSISKSWDNPRHFSFSCFFLSRLSDASGLPITKWGTLFSIFHVLSSLSFLAYRKWQGHLYRWDVPRPENRLSWDGRPKQCRAACMHAGRQAGEMDNVAWQRHTQRHIETSTGFVFFFAF